MKIFETQFMYILNKQISIGSKKTTHKKLFPLTLFLIFKIHNNCITTMANSVNYTVSGKKNLDLSWINLTNLNVLLLFLAHIILMIRFIKT